MKYKGGKGRGKSVIAHLSEARCRGNVWKMTRVAQRTLDETQMKLVAAVPPPPPATTTTTTFKAKQALSVPRDLNKSFHLLRAASRCVLAC